MRFLLIPLLLLFGLPVVHAGTSRIDAVSNALDAFDRSLDKAFDSLGRIDTDKKLDLGHRKSQTLDVGYEPYYYQYWESIGVLTTGMMNSYYANYTYRPPADNILNNTVLNAYAFEVRYAYGSARYKSDSGYIDNDKNYNIEMRGLLEKDYLLSNDLLFTPYLGFGYRNLYNPGNGVQTNLGLWGYDRRSFYYYLPIGIKLDIPHLQGPWSGAFNVEYDYFIRGVQLSDLNEVTPHVNREIPSVSNRQTDGFGLRGSVRLVYSTPRIDFYVEPFIRFWNIEDSKLKTEITHDGKYVFTGYEPHNTTKEIGSKIGLQF